LGDASDTLLAMYGAFGRAGWRVSHLALFPEPNVPDVQEHLLAQDVDCVTEVAGARTWQMTRRPDGAVNEVPLPTRLLSS
jgi:hypothetical protein